MTQCHIQPTGNERAQTSTFKDVSRAHSQTSVRPSEHMELPHKGISLHFLGAQFSGNEYPTVNHHSEKLQLAQHLNNTSRKLYCLTLVHKLICTCFYYLDSLANLLKYLPVLGRYYSVVQFHHVTAFKAL